MCEMLPFAHVAPSPAATRDQGETCPSARLLLRPPFVFVEQEQTEVNALVCCCTSAKVEVKRFPPWFFLSGFRGTVGSLTL